MRPIPHLAAHEENIMGNENYGDDHDKDCGHDRDRDDCKDHDKDHDYCKCKKERDEYKRERDEYRKERDEYKKEREEWKNKALKWKKELYEYKVFVKEALERLGIFVHKLDYLHHDLVHGAKKLGRQDHDKHHDKDCG